MSFLGCFKSTAQIYKRKVSSLQSKTELTKVTGHDLVSLQKKKYVTLLFNAVMIFFIKIKNCF